MSRTSWNRASRNRAELYKQEVYEEESCKRKLYERDLYMRERCEMRPLSLVSGLSVRRSSRFVRDYSDSRRLRDPLHIPSAIAVSSPRHSAFPASTHTEHVVIP
jgi:tRNA 2-selenouridine synthase SelU